MRTARQSTIGFSLTLRKSRRVGSGMANRVIDQQRRMTPRLRRALHYLQHYRGWLVLGFLAAALMICLQICLPWVVKLLFDTLTGGYRASLALLVILVVITGIGAGLCENLKAYAFSRVAEYVLIDVRKSLD